MARPTDAPQGTRDRILVAAATMFGEDPATRLSVRAVAARAGVSTGSLRHHFPTQQDLQDAVLAGLYGFVAPDDPFLDTTVPARERLLRGLQHILALGGVGKKARESLARTYEAFVATDPTEEAHEAYLAVEQAMRHRVEHWLATLVEEGALAAGDVTERARFLLTVVNGLALERALPASESALSAESTTLSTAVDAVFATSAINPSRCHGADAGRATGRPTATRLGDP